MGKKSRQKRSRRNSGAKSSKSITTRNAKASWGLLVLGAFWLGGAGAMWGMKQMSGPEQVANPPKQPTVPPTPAETPTPALPSTVGGVTGCVHRPAFVSQLNLGEQIYIGTNLKGYKGLTLSAKQANGDVVVYQHPTWDDANHLAAYVLDAQGNIFTAPAPFVSLDENPPEEQNNLYKIDTNTGIMKLFMTLPWAAPPNTQNPFGIMGLAYDCETNSLYVSSVAGSTYDAEKGRIFQIDLGKNEVIHQLEGVDAIGLGIHRGVKEKRLYFGSGRNSSIRSVALDTSGKPESTQRLEFYLQQAPGGKDERAKRIQFPQKDAMLVKGIEFNYTLRAASDFVEHDYTYRYEAERDGWKFEEVHRREGTF
jgi:hypothetical protein